jgi:uncharacterized protein (TIGR03118 family)
MRTFFRKWSRNRSRPTGRQTGGRFRPSVEGLETRCLLAVNSFLQTNLVSDIAGIAQHTDPNLINPWGLAAGPGGPFWVSDNNSGLSTLYDNAGNPLSLAVAIPPPAGSPPGTLGTPTGVVFNGGGGFNVSAGGNTGSAFFIFATEDGTIAGWNPGVDPTGKFAGPGGISANAVLEVDNSANPNAADGAVYKGLAMGTDPDGRTLLYAANFRSGTIDIFDAAFHPTTVGASFTPGGAFHDPNLPAGFAPFNVADLAGNLFVSYAKQDASKHDDVGGAGNGFIDEFSTNGFLIRRLVSRGPLDSPWGMTIAPAGFGPFAGDLLVGNFKDGHIHAFTLTGKHPGRLAGELMDVAGNPVTIGGLWSLQFGTGGQGGDPHTLFFTAGIGHEQHGLFGSLQAANPAVFGTDAEARDVLQTNLVSDVAGIARATDANLVNPWGLAGGPGGPFWVSDNGTGISSLYNVHGVGGVAINPLAVNIPAAAGSTAPGSPTGQVFNGAGGFDLTAGNDNTSSIFLFATEDGTIAGWNPGVDPTGKFAGPGGISAQAVTKVDNSAKGANYTGLAEATSEHHGLLLYAANGGGNGSIDVFDSGFHPVDLGPKAFTDPNLPAGFVPYNVQAIDLPSGVKEVLVTYTNFGGTGLIDTYTTDGKFVGRFATGGGLNAPWGMALAPATFGKFAGDLLVGNVADGHITAFTLGGKQVGQLTDGRGRPIAISGLWGLKFGTGGRGGDPNTLYFNAGIGGYQHGLFGALQVIEPITLQR